MKIYAYLYYFVNIYPYAYSRSCNVIELPTIPMQCRALLSWVPVLAHGNIYSYAYSRSCNVIELLYIPMQCRALLSWVPVLAHATRARVSCIYVTPSPQAAAFIPEWDAVRSYCIATVFLVIAILTVLCLCVTLPLPPSRRLHSGEGCRAVMSYYIATEFFVIAICTVSCLRACMGKILLKDLREARQASTGFALITLVGALRLEKKLFLNLCGSIRLLRVSLYDLFTNTNNEIRIE